MRDFLDRALYSHIGYPPGFRAVDLEPRFDPPLLNGTHLCPAKIDGGLQSVLKEMALQQMWLCLRVF